MKTMQTLAVFACTFLLIQGTAKAGTTLDLNALVQEGPENNPEIMAYRAKAEALWERPPQAAAWDDPELMLAARSVPVPDWDFNKIDMTMKEIALSQSIPFPGIPSLRREVAVQDAKMSDRELQYVRLKIAQQIKETYADLFIINAHLATSEKNKNLLETFIEIARAKYEVGSGLQQDILKAQVEHSKFVERIIENNQKKKTATAEMIRLLGRPTGTALAGEPVLRWEPLRYSVDELERMALENNPVLQSYQNSIEKSEAEYKLAKKDYIPSFNISAAYGFRENGSYGATSTPVAITNPDGSVSNATLQSPGGRERRDDVVSIAVGINIPLWFKNKQNRKVAETHLMISEAKSQYSALQNDILFKIRDLAAQEAKGAQLIELYQNGIIPQAAQSLESALAGYQVGSVDFLALLDSQVTLCTYEVQVSEVIADYTKKIAEIESIVGKDLF
jgi:outer membrane protein, heavy metal efflux system